MRVSELLGLLSDFWCYIMHPLPMWPINGYWLCRNCQKKWPVPWRNW